MHGNVRFPWSFRSSHARDGADGKLPGSIRLEREQKRVRSNFLENILHRLRQAESVPVGVEASQSGYLGCAGKAAALPHLAVSEHGKRSIHHGVTVADALRIAATRGYLEGAAPIEIAIRWAFRPGGHLRDVAAKRRLSVEREQLAMNIARWCLQADGVGLRHCGGAYVHQRQRGQQSE